MSATICWEPLSRKPKTLGAFAPESVWEILGQVAGYAEDDCFDLGAITLTMRHHQALQGCLIAYPATKDDPNRKAIEETLRALEEHEALTLWREY